MQEFTAIKDFHSPELQSDYVAGLSYTARPALLPTLDKWVAEGKVVLGRLAPNMISGTGKAE